MKHGMPPDIDCISVNLPAEVRRDSPREITPVTRTRYGLLFQPVDGGYRHQFSGLSIDSRPDGDVAAISRGAVSISPLRFEVSTRLPAELERELTRQG